MSAAPTLEGAVLITCARGRLEPEHIDRLHRLFHHAIDWATLLEAGRWHGMLPLLYHHVHAQDFPVPAQALAHLRSQFEANVNRNLLLSRELLRVLALLRESRIAAVPLKGPALAVAAYGNLALRQFQDLDILVHRHDASRAGDLLRGAGYQPAVEIDPKREAAFRRWNCAETLVGDGGRVVVDLHWDVAPRFYSLHLDLDWMLRRLEPLTLGGEAVPTLAPDAALLYLCVHGAKHCWERLEWLAAVAELIRRRPNVDWDTLVQAARRCGGLRQVHLGLLLAAKVLGAPLPPRITHAGASDPSIRALAAATYARLGQARCGSPGIFQAARFHLASRERARDRLRYCVRFALAPTAGDWSALRLPRWLGFLYYVLRPLRLMKKYAVS